MVCGPTPSVAICNECVELCTEIMAEQSSGPTQAA
jgi:ATP-dependent protease Clp ATPase subunit